MLLFMFPPLLFSWNRALAEKVGLAYILKENLLISNHQSNLGPEDQGQPHLPCHPPLSLPDLWLCDWWCISRDRHCRTYWQFLLGLAFRWTGHPPVERPGGEVLLVLLVLFLVLVLVGDPQVGYVQEGGVAGFTPPTSVQGNNQRKRNKKLTESKSRQFPFFC